MQMGTATKSPYMFVLVTAIVYDVVSADKIQRTLVVVLRCDVVFVNKFSYRIHRIMVNELVTGYVIGSLMIASNLIQIGLTIYQIHEEDKAWLKVIDDLENLVVQQEKYKRKMLEVSSCYNAIQ